MDVEIDLPVEPDELRDRASRATAVAIALITLVAASVGFLQAEAVRHGDEADVEAQRLGVQAFGALVESEAEAQLELEAFGDVVQNSAIRWSLYQDGLGATEPDRPTILAQSELWAQLAAAAAGRTSIGEGSPFGPDLDLAFPRRFLNERSREAFRLAALQDAAVEHAGAWGSRAGAYAAVLAMLAVSVYLLGLSLTVPGRLARRTIALTGAVLATAGLGWTAMNLASPPVRAPDAAAEHFATGRVALLTASRQDEFAAAAQAFGAAIDLRPTFAQAYVNRGAAAFRAGSPQVSGYLSMASPDAVRAARADLQRAVELGLETRSVAGNLAFYAYLEALQAGTPLALEESVRLAQRAVDLGEGEGYADDDLIYLGNLGVAQLAAGHGDAAGVTYDTFIARLPVNDPAGEATRATGVAANIGGGAITDLEVLLVHRPQLAETVAALKGRIVAAVAQVTASGDGATVTAQPDTEVVFPAELQFTVDYEGIGDTDYLSVLWYHEAPDGSGWHVLPEVSGPLWYLDPETEPDVRGEGTGDYTYLASVIELAWPPRCVESGRYRAEIYLNDRLVERFEGTAEWAALQPFVFRDLGIALCGPSDWGRAPERRMGYSDGFVSPDGSRGALVQRIHASGQSFEEVLEAALDREGIAEDIEEVAENEPYFLGLDQTFGREYTYDGGRLRVRVGFVPQEDAYLALVVFGPESWWDEEPACQKDDRRSGEACGPLNVLDSARAFDLAPAGDDEPVDPPATEITFRAIAFSAGLDADAQPVEPFAAAPDGATRLCGSWDFEGLRDGVAWEARWYADGEELADHSVVNATWDLGRAGRHGLCVVEDGGLAPGEYELVLNIEGELERSNALFVGGDHPIVPLRFDNQAAVAACYVYLSLPSAQNWGSDDLGAGESIEPNASATLEVPAGTYDILVEDCEDNALAQEFGVEVGEGAAPFVIPAATD